MDEVFNSFNTYVLLIEESLSIFTNANEDSVFPIEKHNYGIPNISSLLLCTK
jgi:hypothetical protein